MLQEAMTPLVAGVEEGGQTVSKAPMSTTSLKVDDVFKVSVEMEHPRPPPPQQHGHERSLFYVARRAT